MKAHCNSLKYTTLVVIEINGHYGEIDVHEAYSHTSYDLKDKNLVYFHEISSEGELPRQSKTEVFEMATTSLRCYRKIELLLIAFGYEQGNRVITNLESFMEWLEKVHS